jgi:hypothetical protein
MKSLMIASFIGLISILPAHAQKSKLESELQAVINQVGYPCYKVTQVFRNGDDKEGGGIFLSVACSGGQSYMVLANKDDSATVLTCAIADLPGRVCFVKF